MSSHPMLSNALHARVQRKRLEPQRACDATVLCAKKADVVVAPTLQQQQHQAAAAAGSPVVPRKHHHTSPHHHTGHHHVHHATAAHPAGTLMLGGFETNLLDSVHKLFARRMAH